MDKVIDTPLMHVFDMLVTRLTNVEENLCQQKAALKIRGEEDTGLMYGGHWNLPFNFTKSWQGRYRGGSILVRLKIDPNFDWNRFWDSSPSGAEMRQRLKQRHPSLLAYCSTYYVVDFDYDQREMSAVWNLQTVIDRVMAVVMDIYKMEDIVEMDLADVPRGLEKALIPLVDEGFEYKSEAGVEALETTDQSTLAKWGQFLMKYMSYYDLNFGLQREFKDVINEYM